MMIYYVGHTCGTHRMPFTNKYPHMGHTDRVRIPHTIVTHVGHIVIECERLCGTHDEEYVLHVLDKVIKGLESVP